jgi:NADH:ubiquinone oxidoreductase subunit F (NADH-binding)
MTLIARHGERWFRACGTPQEPGTALVTLDGAVARPGVYEIALGTQMSDLLYAAGGVTEAVSAVLTGGYFGSWISGAELAALKVDNASLNRFGAALGAGALYLLPATACGVTESARVITYLARESAGQCGPCVHGLASIADGFRRLARRGGDGDEAARIAHWCTQVRGRGACHHPDGAVRFTASALAVFAEEIHQHVDHSACSGRRGVPLLPIPPHLEPELMAA